MRVGVRGIEDKSMMLKKFFFFFLSVQWIEDVTLTGT